MKALLFISTFFCVTMLAQEPPVQPSSIGKILQITGITDAGSNLPCDPYIVAVATSTIACASCGVSCPIACAASGCAFTAAIIYGSPYTKTEAPREYVLNTNFFGARITRAILNLFIKPSEHQLLHAPHRPLKYTSKTE